MAKVEVHNAVVTRIIDSGLGLLDQSSLQGGVFFEAPTLFNGEYPQPAMPQFQFVSKDGAGWFFVPEVGDEIEVEINVDDGTDDVTDIQLPEPRIRCMIYNSVNDLAAEFKENYGKRMGFKSRGGHILLFDDSPLAGFVRIKTKGGTLLNIDDFADEVTIATNFGDKARISKLDGIQLSSPTAGGTSVSMKTGTVAVEGSTAKLKLGTGKVGVGGPAGELIAELENLAQSAIDDATAASIHVHPTAVGPSGPPTNALSWTGPTGVIAKVTAIKAILTALKGGI